MTSAYELYSYKPFDGSSHSWAKDRLNNLNVTTKVLDVGAGSGFIGKFLSSRGLSELYAVEIDPESGERLKQIYKNIVTDISQLSDIKFDVVTLLDVLEHMPYPDNFLQKLKNYLTDDAVILISVPNIAHWSVRLQLLFGYFNYTAKGILDRTHLRFFTKSTLKECITKAGFEIISYNGSIVPLELVLPDWFCKTIIFKLWTQLRKLSAKILPGLCAYQHLVMIKIDNTKITKVD